jgi:hypothetical protein
MEMESFPVRELAIFIVRAYRMEKANQDQAGDQQKPAALRST